MWSLHHQMWGDLPPNILQSVIIWTLVPINSCSPFFCGIHCTILNKGFTYQKITYLFPWQHQLRYLVSLSGALALLNMVPCYSLDGQWALFALVDHTLSLYIPHEDQRNMLCNVILTLGTLLLAANIMLALWTLGSV